MNRYVITLLITCLAARMLQAATATTDYILPFLKESTTLWRDSHDWKAEMHNEHAEAETKYAQASSQDFVKTDVKGHFKLHKDGDTVEITTEIEENEVTQAQNDNEFELFKNIVEDINGKRTEQTDSCSACNHLIQALLDAQKRQLKITLNSNCTSKIPYALFMQRIAASTQE
jgi:hypothetical protein